MLVLCVAALLALQTVGLHLHANPHTDGMQMHAEHIHSVDPDGHDHSADLDVTIIELGMLWAKLLPALLCAGLLLPVPLLLRWAGCGWYHSLLPPGNTSRWRPPLRAPPLVA